MRTESLQTERRHRLVAVVLMAIGLIEIGRAHV